MKELLENPFALFTAAAGAVVLLRNSYVAILDLIKIWKTPDANQNSRIAALEEATQELRREAQAFRSRLDKNDDGMVVMFKGQLALLGHGIDGNNVDEMRSAREAIQAHLLKK